MYHATQLSMSLSRHADVINVSILTLGVMVAENNKVCLFTGQYFNSSSTYMYPTTYDI